MTPENPGVQAQVEEKYRVLSRSPLTAAFLKGNTTHPDWALSVFRESDAIVEKIVRTAKKIESDNLIGMKKDQGKVVIAMGYELGVNAKLFAEEITKRLIDLRWILPEEIILLPYHTTPAKVVATYLSSGFVYRALEGLGAALAHPEK